METPRLLLRQFTMADASLILGLNSKAATVKFLHEPLLQTIADAEKVLTQIILPQYKLNLGRWAVHLKDSNAFIGWCGLKYSAALNETDIGYRFLEQYWGKGYATEAAKHTLEYAFNTLHLQSVTGRAHIDNTASIKILETIGMQFIQNEVIDDCPVKMYTAVA